jgi:hypothetical protein
VLLQFGSSSSSVGSGLSACSDNQFSNMLTTSGGNSTLGFFCFLTVLCFVGWVYRAVDCAGQAGSISTSSIQYFSPKRGAGLWLGSGSYPMPPGSWEKSSRGFWISTCCESIPSAFLPDMNPCPMLCHLQFMSFFCSPAHKVYNPVVNLPARLKKFRPGNVA